VAGARLAADRFDPADELRDFILAQQGVGAVASFTGIARATAKDGGTVTALFLDHHPRLTLRSLDEIAADARSRFEIIATRLVHRCGMIAPGEPIVFVAAAAVHRRAAFEAVDYMMDRLKSEAVFWKREDRAEGSPWIEPTVQDGRDLARWRS
jgi:molybdopterin synthase catalytic subunit